MRRLMQLAPATRIHPGRREPATIGDEWQANPFVQICRGLAAESTERCTVGVGDDAIIGGS
jgi:hypothetical protein